MELISAILILGLGLSTTGIFSIIASIISVVTAGAAVVAGVKAKKQAEAAELQAQAVMISGHDNNRGLYVVYGKARVGSTTVYKTVSKTTGTVRSQAVANSALTHWNVSNAELEAASSDRHAFLRRAVAICEGPIESIDNIYVDNDPYNDARFNERGNKHFHALTTLGEDAGVHVDLFETQWDSTKTAKGIAAGYEFITMDIDSAYQGEPKTQYLVRGRKIYDPRLDTTVGGSGSHRQNDATTWAYSANPALCLLDYLTNSRYGRGLSYSVIDLDSFISGADACDATVSSNGGSIARLECNIALDPKNPVLDNVRTLLESMKGSLHYVNGNYQLFIEDVASTAMVVLEEDLIGGLNIQGGERDKRINRATVKFANATKEYATDQVSWPELDSTAYSDYLAEDNNEQLHKTFTLDAVTNYHRAQDLAEYIVRDSRIGSTVSGRMKSTGLLLVPGDIIALSYSPAGFVNKLLRIQSIQFDTTKLEVAFVAREYEPDVYYWSTKANEPAQALVTMPTYNSREVYVTVDAVTVVEETRGDGSVEQFAKVEYSLNTNLFSVVATFIDSTGRTSSGADYMQDLDGELLVALPKDNETYTFQVQGFAFSGDKIRAGAASQGTLAVSSITGSKLAGIQAGATAGAIFGTNVTDSQGNTVTDADALNDVLRADLTEVTLENGTTIQDENGNDVILNHLGDVAMYQYNTMLALKTDVQTALDAAANAGGADGQIDSFFTPTAPTGTLATGDLWFDSDDGNKLYRYDGSSWVVAQDTGIASAVSAASTAQSTADGKVATFFQTSAPTAEGVGDLWYDTDDSQFRRWNGSSWVVVANAYSDTNQLTDGASLGQTSLWSGVTGTGRPDDNATVGANWGSNISNQPDDNALLNQNQSWSDVSGTGRPDDNATVGASWGSNISGQPTDSALLNVNQTWSDVGGSGRPEDNATVGADWNTNITNQPADSLILNSALPVSLTTSASAIYWTTSDSGSTYSPNSSTQTVTINAVGGSSDSCTVTVTFTNSAGSSDYITGVSDDSSAFTTSTTGLNSATAVTTVTHTSSGKTISFISSVIDLGGGTSGGGGK